MPLKDDDEQRIRKNFEEIVQAIQKDALQNCIDKMYGAYCLTGDDKERIAAATTSSDKNRIFLDRLITGPPYGYSIFISFLEDDDIAYRDLLQKIKDTPITKEVPQTFADWVGVENLKGKADMQLKDLDLLNFSKALSPQYFSQFGTILGLDHVVVQNIDFKYNRAPAAASQELLFTWRNKLGNKATARELLEKLFTAPHESVDRKKVIEALKNVKPNTI